MQRLISIVVPVHNEAGNIAELLRRVQAALKELDLSTEVIFVDDGSTDESWRVITELSQSSGPVRGYSFSRNFGKDSALRYGLEQARGDAVVAIDADLQHPPELLPKMISLWQNEHFEVVEAVKVERGEESRIYRLSALLFYTLITKLSGFSFRNATDFKLLDRRVVVELLRMDERLYFFRGLCAWIGFRRAEVPIAIESRVAGRSSFGVLKLVRLFFNGMTAFSALPLQIVSLLGLGFLIFALILGVQTLINYLTGTAVSGFTTVILLQLIVGSAVLLGLGIAGCYISTIYNEVKRRPYCIVRDSCSSEQK